MKTRNIVKLAEGLPLLWLILFVLLPVLILATVSLSEQRLGIPPYKPLLEWSEGVFQGVNIGFKSYFQLAEDGTLQTSFRESIELAGLTTLFCLLIGWPMAWAIARSDERHRGALLLLIMLPFWTSFLVRIYAWMTILDDNGLFNSLLLGLGLIEDPIVIMNTDWAVLLGMVYAYLPFMILPLYAVLERLEPSLLEAAADLGAKPFTIFRKVLLPLSMPGVLAGSAIVFVPALGEYVIPELMGGGDTAMMGKMMWDIFALTRDWPGAAALAVVLLASIALPLALLQRFNKRMEADEA